MATPTNILTALKRFTKCCGDDDQTELLDHLAANIDAIAEAFGKTVTQLQDAITKAAGIHLRGKVLASIDERLTALRAERNDAKDDAHEEALTILATSASWDGYGFSISLEQLLGRCLPAVGGFLVVTLGSDGDEWIAIRGDKLRAIAALKRPTLWGRITKRGLVLRDTKTALRLTIYDTRHTTEYDRAEKAGRLSFTDLSIARKATA